MNLFNDFVYKINKLEKKQKKLDRMCLFVIVPKFMY